MPEICRFYGIVIYIYYDDHNPPHFHAVYGNFEAQILIHSLSLLSGALPPRALGLAIEWASMHKSELSNVWKQAEKHQTLDKIEPLK